MEQVLIVSNVALWIVVVLQTLFILVQFHYIGLLLDRFPPEGPVLGQRAPKKEVVDIDGRTYLLGGRSERNRVLIFTSPSCPWCEKLAPDIAPFTQSLSSDYEVLLINNVDLDAEAAQAYGRRLANNSSARMVVAPFLLESYRVRGTPYAVLIDKEGVVRNKGVTNTRTDLETLVNVIS